MKPRPIVCAKDLRRPMTPDPSARRGLDQGEAGQRTWIDSMLVLTLITLGIGVYLALLVGAVLLVVYL